MPRPLRGRSEVGRLRDDLERLFKRFDSLSVDEHELRADFVGYLCVRTTGFLERAVAALFVEMARQRASTDIVSYVEQNMERFQNPRPERLVGLLGRFSKRWQEELEAFMADEGHRDALGSLVALRNRIAHGDPSTGLTFARLDEYRTKVSEIVDFIADLLVPVP